MFRCKVIIMCLFVGAVVSLSAGQDLGEKVIQTRAIAALQSIGSSGTEFYFTFVPCYDETGNSKLMLYITSAVDGVARVEVKGKGFVVNVKVKANNIVPVEIGSAFGQVFTKSINGAIPPEQVYLGAAVHVSSSVPIVVTAVTRFNYTSDSFLALPVQSLGTQYIVASMADISWMSGGSSLPSETSITAAYDNTKVEFVLGGPSLMVSGGGMHVGDKKTFVMNKGDVWVIGNDASSAYGDVSGSTIVASKPVAVVSGNQCANVPTTLRWCDYISEMELPTSLWGTHVQVPKYASRINGYFMKVFAKEQNTKLFYNGSYWKSIQTVGGQEGTGWISQRVDASGNNVVSLSADKPISVTVFNPGQEDDNVSTDPFQMAVVPVEQYQKEILFSTPGSIGGLGFTRNFIGVVFQLDSITGKIPDDLEFGNSVKGVMTWRKFSVVYGPSIYSKDNFVQSVNGKKYAFRECVLPSDNSYAIRCATPIMLYLYGGSDYDSYGHPASVAGYLNSKDSLPPSVEYHVECDGSVGVKTIAAVEDLPMDSTIRSNLSAAYLRVDSYNYSLSVDTLDAGTTSRTNWRASVIDLDKNAHAIVVFVDQAGNSKSVLLDYTAITFKPSSTSYDIGTTNTNSPISKSIRMSNNSSVDVIATRIDFKDGGKDVFSFSPVPTFPPTIAAGDSLMLTVRFLSSTAGVFLDSIGVGTDCSYSLKSAVIARAEDVNAVDNKTEERQHMNLSPNPVDKTLTLELDDMLQDQVSIELFDLSGKRVRVLNCPAPVVDKRRITVDVADLATGVYHFSVQSSGCVLSRTIIIAH